jgi:uncharacterized membrane protein
MERLAELFSYLCGQVHLCTIGREAIPICERCTGLYVGAAYVLLVLVIFRPEPSKRMLWFHGLCMLLMLPFGYHFVAHGTMMRMAMGQLFAYGLVYFLLLLPVGSEWQHTSMSRVTMYLVMAVAGIPLLLLAIRFGGHTTAVFIVSAATFGVAVLALLVTANLATLAVLLTSRRATPA